MWMTEGFHRPTCLEPQGLVPGRQSPPGTSPVSKRSSVAWGHVSSGAQRGGQPPRGGAGGSRRASVLAATGRRIGALEGLDSGDNECCSATTNVAGIRRSPVGGPTPARAPAFVSRTHIHAWRPSKRGLGRTCRGPTLMVGSARLQVVANGPAHNFPGGHALFCRPMLDSLAKLRLEANRKRIGGR